MIKIGVNGFGRIGRAFFRICMLHDDFEIVYINDINPSVDNLAYLLKFDSVYSKFDGDVAVDGDSLVVNGNHIKVTHEADIRKPKWNDPAVDVIVDSSGVVANHKVAHELINDQVKKVVITHSSKEVDKTIIFGVNENLYDNDKDRVLSSSICDTNAIAPVLKILDSNFGIDSGNVMTLHPWLGYQNLSDGPCRSFAYPGEIYENFSLGRASTESLMPKTTSCVDAALDVMPELDGKLISMSFRVPTPIVSCAVMNINLEKKASLESVVQVIDDACERQQQNVLSINSEPLISKDFLMNSSSAIVDNRWVDIDNNNCARIVVWYDNEWGYSSRVADLVKMISK